MRLLLERVYDAIVSKRQNVLLYQYSKKDSAAEQWLYNPLALNNAAGYWAETGGTL